MSFKVIDNKLLKNYIKIWERASSLMNIELDSQPVYGNKDKYIKTKIKSYEAKIEAKIEVFKVKRHQKKMYQICVCH